MKDAKYDSQETAGIEGIVTGIALSKEDDEGRLALGSEIFDGLYECSKRKRPDPGRRA